MAKVCWSRQREAGEKGGKGGKGESKSEKGAGGPKGQRSPSTPATSSQPATAPGGGSVGESLVLTSTGSSWNRTNTMLRCMDSEEKRRNDAELAAAEAKAKTEAAKASAPSGPFLAATLSTGSSFLQVPRILEVHLVIRFQPCKYLPQLPVIAHQEMGRDRMREIEAWHGFRETMSSCPARRGLRERASTLH